MNVLSGAIYRIIRFGYKAYLRIFFDFACWGRENIPPGPKIFCSNHFSSSDPFFAITLIDEPVHMVLGAAYGFPVLPFFLDAGEQINASGDARSDVVPKAVKYLRRGESVYIFPEGDLNDQVELRSFYRGLAKIYFECPVPIVPIGLVAPRRNVKSRDVHVREVLYHRLVVASRHYYANIGEAMLCEDLESLPDRKEAENELTGRVRDGIQRLILDIKENKFWS